MQNVPFFSICVPTRNRPDTLYYCLQTLLDQDFDSYEIIISDNCDEDYSKKTRELVDSFASQKIKYFKTDHILSMTGNYEFALSKASGEFILCMGDDDGLVTNSLGYVHNFILKYDARVVKSPAAWYFWPGSFDFPDSLMSFPSARPVEIVDCKSLLAKVARFELGYFNLPMIYYSFVARSIIDECVREKGEFFQNAASIDMYSGFVIAWKTKHFHVADESFAIAGQSSRSNGATVGNNINDRVSNEFFKQHNLVETYRSYQVPLLPSYDLSTFVLLELKKFVKNYNISEADLPLMPRKVILNFISTQPVVENLTEIRNIEYFDAFPVYHEDVKALKKNFIGKRVYFPFMGKSDVQIFQNAEIIDPRIFKISDVYGAAKILRRLSDSRNNLEPILIEPFVKATRPLHSRIFTRIKVAIGVLLGR